MKRKRSKSPPTAPTLFAEPSKLQRITDLKVVARNPNMREVRVDGRRIAVIRAADAEMLALHVGRKWSKALASRLAEAVEEDRVRKTAMSLLGKRAYSHSQLVERLLRRTDDAAMARRIADEAQLNGWLNDAAFAADVVRSTNRAGQVGRRLLSKKLESKGVNATTIARVIASESPLDERQAAWELARKRIVTMSALSPQAMTRRLAGLLARKGFEDDVIEHTIERLQPLMHTQRDHPMEP